MALVRSLLLPAAYIALAAGLYILLDRYEVHYFSTMARPILDDYMYYTYFLLAWFIATLLSYVPIIGIYLFIAPNALLLSNSYFAIILRMYFSSFPVFDFLLYGSTIIAITALMMLRKMSAELIIVLNICAAFSALSFALQYALIATS